MQNWFKEKRYHSIIRFRIIRLICSHMPHLVIHPRGLVAVFRGRPVAIGQILGRILQ
jgi:hypothetical protein